jgi:hypothetical protein
MEEEEEDVEVGSTGMVPIGIPGAVVPGVRPVVPIALATI